MNPLEGLASKIPNKRRDTVDELQSQIRKKMKFDTDDEQSSQSSFEDGELSDTPSDAEEGQIMKISSCHKTAHDSTFEEGEIGDSSSDEEEGQILKLNSSRCHNRMESTRVGDDLRYNSSETGLSSLSSIRTIRFVPHEREDGEINDSTMDQTMNSSREEGELCYTEEEEDEHAETVRSMENVDHQEELSITIEDTIESAITVYSSNENLLEDLNVSESINDSDIACTPERCIERKINNIVEEDKACDTSSNSETIKNQMEANLDQNMEVFDNPRESISKEPECPVVDQIERLEPETSKTNELENVPVNPTETNPQPLDGKDIFDRIVEQTKILLERSVDIEKHVSFIGKIVENSLHLLEKDESNDKPEKNCDMSDEKAPNQSISEVEVEDNKTEENLEQAVNVTFVSDVSPADEIELNESSFDEMNEEERLKILKIIEEVSQESPEFLQINTPLCQKPSQDTIDLNISITSIADKMINSLIEDVETSDNAQVTEISITQLDDNAVENCLISMSKQTRDMIEGSENSKADDLQKSLSIIEDVSETLPDPHSVVLNQGDINSSSNAQNIGTSIEDVCLPSMQNVEKEVPSDETEGQNTKSVEKLNEMEIDVIEKEPEDPGESLENSSRPTQTAPSANLMQNSNQTTVNITEGSYKNSKAENEETITEIIEDKTLPAQNSIVLVKNQLDEENASDNQLSIQDHMNYVKNVQSTTPLKDVCMPIIQIFENEQRCDEIESQESQTTKTVEKMIEMEIDSSCTNYDNQKESSGFHEDLGISLNLMVANEFEVTLCEPKSSEPTEFNEDPENLIVDNEIEVTTTNENAKLNSSISKAAGATLEKDVNLSENQIKMNSESLHYENQEDNQKVENLPKSQTVVQNKLVIPDDTTAEHYGASLTDSALIAMVVDEEDNVEITSCIPPITNNTPFTQDTANYTTHYSMQFETQTPVHKTPPQRQTRTKEFSYITRDIPLFIFSLPQIQTVDKFTYFFHNKHFTNCILCGNIFHERKSDYDKNQVYKLDDGTGIINVHYTHQNKTYVDHESTKHITDVSSIIKKTASDLGESLAFLMEEVDQNTKSTKEYFTNYQQVMVVGRPFYPNDSNVVAISAKKIFPIEDAARFEFQKDVLLFYETILNKNSS